MHNDRLEYRLIVRAAQLYYHNEERLEQREIAKKLKISPSKVSRLLKQADESGIVRIHVETSRETKLEYEIIQRFNLTDARVIVTDEDINLKAEIGKAAAQYFEQTVSEGIRIGIGGGQTLYHMLEFLPKKQRKIEIYPLFAGRKSPLVDFIDPNVLVALLWQKCAHAAFAYTLDIPPYEGTGKEIEKEKEVFLKRSLLDQVTISGAGYR